MLLSNNKRMSQLVLLNSDFADFKKAYKSLWMTFRIKIERRTDHFIIYSDSDSFNFYLGVEMGRIKQERFMRKMEAIRYDQNEVL